MVMTGDNMQLSEELIKLATPQVSVLIGTLHFEFLNFFVLESLPAGIVLGISWINQHYPVIDWEQGDVISGGPKCHGSSISMLLRSASLSQGSALILE